MQPVASVEEMRAADAAAQRRIPLDVLVGRAGRQLGRAALRALGGGYGRRAAVVCGKGNNGADGRVAAAFLAGRGVRVAVFEAAEAPPELPACDVVVDAAYGTGFRGEYRAPAPPTGAVVVAADIPSGVQGDTGDACTGAVVADVTVTFESLKAGLLIEDGPAHAGRVEVAGIGLPVGPTLSALVEDMDVASLWPGRARDAHKWTSALAVVAGSPGMIGAARLLCAAAMRSGAGMVRLGMPSVAPGELPPTEAVSAALPKEGWAEAALDMASRCRASVVGPGLGRDPASQEAVRAYLARSPLPAVVDADGLYALGDLAGACEVVAGRTAATVLTPHDGELARLRPRAQGTDRIAHVRAVASGLGAVVLAKGPTTVVAAPDGRVRLVTSGTQALASAGTGDVLSGMIGALLACGMDPLHAAALGAHVHGLTGRLSPGPPGAGMVAGDLPALIPVVLTRLFAAAEEPVAKAPAPGHA